ncbi:MAG: Copper Transporter integral membrane protein that functions in high affinity copper transport [Peltula sp. TS41687]|nr:MAG: Copper Transporter integral membrane protein that functions in high affinity copper transport [Peltula sp. TS41687]
MDMGGMDMGGAAAADTHACKISMLWNWYTVDSCFIARSWHVRSHGTFAVSCIGVVLLVILLEGLRRTQRELDRYLLRRAAAASASASASSPARQQSDDGGDTPPPGKAVGGETTPANYYTPADASLAPPRHRSSSSNLKLWQQMLRSVLYMFQFAVGYFVMLLAMYYNGYIIVCIFLGAFLGAMVFHWDTFGPPTQHL